MRSNENIQQLAAVMSRPYTLTKSRLGTVTKVFSKNFLCNEQGVYELNGAVLEKLRFLNPTQHGFQYLISFSDKTHCEHHEIATLPGIVRHSGKMTERLILKWVIKHTVDESYNELTAIVRIANPINPLILLQAALSKSTEDIDNLDFEGGSVSVSVDGAGQITAEEIFSVVARWIDSRPQPQYFTTLHETIVKNQDKIEFLNHALLPTLIAMASFIVLWKHTPPSLSIPFIFGAIVIHSYAKSLAESFNRRIEHWCRKSRLFSVFQLTGGDTNQQAKFAVRSKNSIVKLIASTALSFILNVLAGIATIILY